MQSEKKCSQKLYTRKVKVVDGNDPDTCKASKRSRKRKKTHHREVKVDRFQNMETLVVTQKVKVKKQKFKCIINLTKICKHKSEKPKSKRRPTIKSERIVPQCLRKCSRDENAMKRSKQESSSHAKKKSSKTKCELDSLSVISLSSLENYSELSYEDVSSDSFTTISSEDDIDFLIKRTKDRDRQLSKSFSSQCSQNGNTAIYQMLSDISDADASILRSSDKDSLRSTTTLVIAPHTQPETYSPTRPTSTDNYLFMDKSHRKSFEENHHDLYSPKRQFSPTLTSEENSAKVYSVDYQHSCIIKNEPYSPSEEPVCCYQENLPYEVDIKFEDTEMDDFTDKTKNPKSLDIIEGNPKIKKEGGLYSPPTNCVLPECDQRYTNQSSRSDRCVKVKIEKDVNGNENNVKQCLHQI